MAKLGDVCNFYSGTGFPNAYQGDKHGKYPFYKVGDISKNVISGNVELISCDNYINDDVVNLIKGTIIPPQCVVFAKIGEALKLNRRALTSCYCLVDNNVMGVQANNLYLDSRYFYYFMCNVDLQRYSESTAVPSVRKSRIAEIEIPLPSLEEQRHIAAILDKVTDLIAQRRAQLDKLDLLVKSRFVEMFGDPIKNDHGWDVISLIDATTKIGSGATPKGGQASYQSSGISLIRSMNVYDGNFVHRELAHISDSQAKLLDNVSVNKNDILFNITGASIARACIVPEDILPARVNQHVAIIRCKPSSFNPIFVNQQLINVSYKKLLLSIGESGGATREAITKQDLSNTSIIAPPIIFQNQYAKFVTHIQNIKSKVQCSLAELVVLKESLMQKYFE